MTFCEALEEAEQQAPNEDARAAVEELIVQYCGNTGQGGGNGNGPPGGLN